MSSIPYQVGKALKEDKAVREETLRGAKAFPREFVQGVVLGATHPKQAAKGMAQYYSETYGPLLAGDTKKFRKGLAKPGTGGAVGPLLDLSIVAPGASLLAGKAGKAGLLGKKTKRLMTTERPRLRYSPGEKGTEAQPTSPRLVKRKIQQRRDIARAQIHRERYKTARAAQEAGQKQESMYRVPPTKEAVASRGGISFGGGRVLSIPHRLTAESRLRHKAGAGAKGRQRLFMLAEQHAYEKRVRSTKAGFSKPQREAALLGGLEGDIPVADPAQARKWIDRRIGSLRTERGRRAGRGAPVRQARARFERGKGDEVRRLKALRDEIDAGRGDEIFNRDFQRRIQALRKEEVRAAGVDPFLHEAGPGQGIGQAQLRRYKPQVESLIRSGALPAIEKVLDRSEANVARALEAKQEIRRLTSEDARLRKEGKAPDSKERAQIARDRRKALNKLERARTALFSDETMGRYMNTIGLRRIVKTGQKLGLERPAYLRAEPTFRESFAQKAVGGSRGARGYERSTGELRRTGRRALRMEAFLEGIQQSVKNKHQAELIAKTIEQHALPIDELLPGALRRGEGLRTMGRETSRQAAKKAERAGKRQRGAEVAGLARRQPYDYFASKKSIARAIERGQVKKGAEIPEGAIRVTPQEARRAKRRLYEAHQPSKGRTAKQAFEDADELGIDTSNMTLFNPRRIRSAIDRDTGEPIWSEANTPELIREINRSTIQSDAEVASHGFAEQKGWHWIPNDVFDELQAAAGDLSKFARTLDISKGKASRILLGLLNTSWVAFQFGANAFLSMIVDHTGPYAAIRGYLEWKKIPAAERAAIEPVLNVGTNVLDTGQRSLGATGGKFANRYRAFQRTAMYRHLRKGNLPRHIINASIWLDRHQTAGWRKGMFMNNARREALRQMGKELNQGAAIQERVMHPWFSGKLHDRIRAIVRDQDQAKKLGQHVDKVLGDYLTFTAAERATLQRFTMFYGFLRHSIQLALWTLPTEHPITVGILGRLALLEDKEKREMLGVDDIPFQLAGLDFTFAGRHMQVNVARMSPVGNALFEARGPTALLGILPPAITIPLQQIFGFKLYSGKPLRVRGQTGFDAVTEILNNPSRMNLIDHLRVFANQVESYVPPLRQSRRFVFKGPQGDDAVVTLSLVGKGAAPMREIKEPTTAARIKASTQRAARTPWTLKVFEALTGTREITPEELQQLRQKKGAKKAKKAGGAYIPSSAGTSSPAYVPSTKTSGGSAYVPANPP